MKLNMEKNDIKKDLYRSKVKANMTHYRDGKLYYEMEVLGNRYAAAIITGGDTHGADFEVVMEARHLWRWIDKAIDNNDFVCMSALPLA